MKRKTLGSLTHYIQPYGEDLMKRRKRTKWKRSQFTMRLPGYPEKGQHLVYNTLTRATARIDDTGWDKLQNLPGISGDSDFDKWLGQLADGGFIVPQALDEGEGYIQHLQSAKQNTDHLYITLSLIQKCNFG